MITARPKILYMEAPWKKIRLMRNASMMETTERMRKTENVPISLLLSSDATPPRPVPSRDAHDELAEQISCCLTPTHNGSWMLDTR
jgi:hypothetical protein